MSDETLLVRHRADEFALLRERAHAHGIRWTGRPTVERVHVTAGSGRRVSAIRWGAADPEIVLLHGGAQNAHTWDAVALVLGRPVLCIDLPGHGLSDWRDDHDYRPRSMVPDVADAIAELAPGAGLLVGMSLGGMTAIALTGDRPELVRRLAVVDVAPGSGRKRTGPLFDFISGPESFETLEELIDRAVRFAPSRSRESLTVGILHNAEEQPDGTWRWRYDPTIGSRTGVAGVADEMLDMWDAIGAITVPTLLVTGSKSDSVSPDAVQEWQRRQPHVGVADVEGAGHSVQSDKPVVLAQLLSELLESQT